MSWNKGNNRNNMHSATIKNACECTDYVNTLRTGDADLRF